VKGLRRGDLLQKRHFVVYTGFISGEEGEITCSSSYSGRFPCSYGGRIILN